METKEMFFQMTIAKRLLIAFGLSLIVTITIGVIGYQGIFRNLKMTDTLIHKDADFLSNALILITMEI